MAKSTAGRKKGGKNQGFFYRSGTGWFANDCGRMIPLADSEGNRLRERKLPVALVREAHARWLVDKTKDDQADSKATKAQAQVTILQVCQAYLANVKSTGAVQTHKNRADTLFDLCFGIPPEFRNKKDDQPLELTAKRKKEMAAKRIHDG
ncbi:MAG: hypothetical protein AAGD11_04230 [Planctomycetota bacterium]